jgi:AcrR family transcriptional regulator
MREETTTRRPRVDAQRNRERLLEAARAAFAAGRDTARPVTLEQVARQAGVGIGTLYRHFPSREALVEALYREELEQLSASVATLLARHRPDLALRGWMDNFAEYAQAKREMGDALRALIDTGVVTAAKSRERLAGALRQLLQAGAADGSLRAGLRADDMVTAVVGMVSATALAGGREQLGRLFDLLLDAARPGAADGEVQRLRFRAAHLPAVRDGRKRVTMRFQDPVRVGPVLLVFGSGEVSVPGRITSTVAKPLDAITDEEAREDGFTGAAGVLPGLRDYYPNLRGSDEIVLVRFEVDE